MTDNELYSMFITCGPLASAKIMRDRTSGYSYGYGFVQYQVTAKNRLFFGKFFFE
jgi:RNA recognition motif-containing protein